MLKCQNGQCLVSIFGLSGLSMTSVSNTYFIQFVLVKCLIGIFTYMLPSLLTSSYSKYLI